MKTSGSALKAWVSYYKPKPPARLRLYCLPNALFGHSMGGLVGFEFARWLAGRLAGPAHLFVSGARAPNGADPFLPIHNLPDDQFVQALRRLNGTPETVLQNPEQMELFSPVLRADFEAVETYTNVPGAPLACPISAFGGSIAQDLSAA